MAIRAERPGIVRAGFGLLLAVGLLDIALTMRAVWPSFLVRPAAELSVELLLLLLLAAGLVTRHGRLGLRARRMLLVLLLLLVLGRYADVTAPNLFGRELNLYWDLRHLPSVAAMVWAAVPAWRIALGAAAAVAALAATVALLRCCVGLLAEALEWRRLRRAVAGLASLGLAAYAAGAVSERIAAERWFALPVTPAYVRQLTFALAAANPGVGIAATGAAETARPLPPGALCGADLIILFVESYGAVVFENPALAARLADRYAALTATIDRRGFRVASAYVDSPTFGGGSWLAHASLLMGVQATDQQQHDLLLASGRTALPARFRAIGYRAVGLFPGLKRPWPEGAAYGFDRLYDAAALDYRGPAFGWWAIPDQFALEVFYRREIAAPDRPPLVVAGATIMSHMPFRPVPAYAADWSALGDGSALPPPRPDESAGLGDSYRSSIGYALDALRGFLDHRAPEDAVLLLLGDHQPVAAVSGPGASRAVPAHIVARRPEPVERFVAAGFAEGLAPRRPAIGPMSDLHGLLLQAAAETPCRCDPP